MQPESDARSRYLALALDARRIIDALLGYVETGNNTSQMSSALVEAVESLRSIKDGAQLSQPAQSHLAFDHYEQILTLDQIKSKEDREPLIADLLALEGQTGNAAELTERARRAITFFFAVETRALHYYSRPPMAQGYYHSAWRQA